MSEPFIEARRFNEDKARRAIRLVSASLADYRPFDPAADYTPKALEPYDALADRGKIGSILLAAPRIRKALVGSMVVPSRNPSAPHDHAST